MIMARYNNTPIVVVVLLPIRGSLLMIQCALAREGYGTLALCILVLPKQIVAVESKLDCRTAGH
jgi:hypothetical protein